MKVILFVILMLSDQEPQVRQYDQPSAEVCLRNITEIVKTTASKIVKDGGAIQVGCFVLPNTDIKS